MCEFWLGCFKRQIFYVWSHSVADWLEWSGHFLAVSYSFDRAAAGSRPHRHYPVGHPDKFRLFSQLNDFELFSPEADEITRRHCEFVLLCRFNNSCFVFLRDFQQYLPSGCLFHQHHVQTNQTLLIITGRLS